MREDVFLKKNIEKRIGSMSSKQAIHFYSILAYKANPKSKPIELVAAMNIYHCVLYVRTVITARGKNIFLYN